MRCPQKPAWTHFYLTVREGPHYHPSAEGRPVVLVHRIGNIKRWTSALVAVVVLFLLAASPAAGASGCGQKIVDDWFEDGRVDKVYAIKCYRAALKLLPEDAQNYSSAPDEINRALQDAIRQKQEEEAAKAAAAEAEQQAAEAASESPAPPPPSAPSTPEPRNDADQKPEAETKAAEAETEEESSAGATESDLDPPPRPDTEPATTGDVAGTTAENTSTAGAAEEDTNGLAGEAIGKLGSGSADSVPVPLIIIGGLALALLAAGGAGLIARRHKARNQ